MRFDANFTVADRSARRLDYLEVVHYLYQIVGMIDLSFGCRKGVASVYD
jgi:hypothetical protein